MVLRVRRRKALVLAAVALLIDLPGAGAQGPPMPMER
jgi:hypothetical protein